MDDAQLIDSPRERSALTFVQFPDYSLGGHVSGILLACHTSVMAFPGSLTQDMPNSGWRTRTATMEVSIF